MKVGASWESAGRFQEARAAYELAVKDEVTRPSDSGLRQAAARNSLALMDRHLGLYAEARQEYGQAQGLIERSRGPQSSEYASSLSNLAVLDYNEGRFDAAARQFRLALRINENMLGEKHPATAQTLNSLSAVFAGQGKYVDAERLCKRALTIQEQILGPEHFQVSVTLDNLASIYRRKAKFEAALELSLRADQIARSTFGDRHPLTCLRANKLAVLYADTGRLSEAESLLRRTLEIQVRALGEENPDVATTMANLAAICVRRKLAVEADSLYRRLLAILDRSRPNDRKLVSVLGDYAWLLRQTGRSREAKKLESRAREIAAMYPSIGVATQWTLSIYSKRIDPWRDASRNYSTNRDYWARLIDVSGRGLELRPRHVNGNWPAGSTTEGSLYDDTTWRSRYWHVKSFQAYYRIKRAHLVDQGRARTSACTRRDCGQVKATYESR